eukprot:6209759-Pleurochrysis_carterae.AAC.2
MCAGASAAQYTASRAGASLAGSVAFAGTVQAAGAAETTRNLVVVKMEEHDTEETKQNVKEEKLETEGAKKSGEAEGVDDLAEERAKVNGVQSAEAATSTASVCASSDIATAWPVYLSDAYADLRPVAVAHAVVTGEATETAVDCNGQARGRIRRSPQMVAWESGVDQSFRTARAGHLLTSVTLWLLPPSRARFRLVALRANRLRLARQPPPTSYRRRLAAEVAVSELLRAYAERARLDLWCERRPPYAFPDTSKPSALQLHGAHRLASPRTLLL